MTAPQLALVPTDVLEVGFRVRGIPVTQGFMRSLGKGRPMVYGNAKTLLPWRRLVASIAEDFMRGRPPTPHPVVMNLGYYLPRPKTVTRSLPTSRRDGDIDKYQRAIFDSLTGVVYEDDAQVVTVNATKVWHDDQTNPGWDPGVTIMVRAVRP